MKSPHSSKRRLVGIDLARALALIGMATTHLLVVTDSDGPTGAGLVASGRSAALFAVLAGVAVALTTGGQLRPSPGRQTGVAGAGLMARAAVIGAIGLLLALIDPPAMVILAYYGLLFLLAIPLLKLEASTLLKLAVVWCLISPVLSHVMRGSIEEAPADQPDVSSLLHPIDLLTTLLFTGTYPVLQWMTYLLVGMGVGRLALRQRDRAPRLLAAGVAVAGGTWIVSAILLGPVGGADALGRSQFSLLTEQPGATPTDSWWWLAVIAPHSGTPLDLAHTAGCAVAVIGACLLLCRGKAAAVLFPLIAMGSIPLTLYVAHVVAFDLYSAELVSLLVTHIVVGIAFAVALRLAGRRAPLETLVAFASRKARERAEARYQRRRAAFMSSRS